VESASAEAIYENPQHEYTRKLLAAAPSFDQLST
jgi:ABC-type oligopeptide transport system ATPase subunit